RRTQSAAKSAGRASSATDPPPSAHNSRRPSPCLQGCLRLGQVQRNDGSSRSIVTWYGSRALPWHRPPSSDPLDPACDHTADSDSRRAAAAEAASGASLSTSSTVQGVPASATTAMLKAPGDAPTLSEHGDTDAGQGRAGA